ncbi:ABC transporter F family member 4-like isoform X11 [Amblyraja radiata]|uniref:ABC transporter F family member 4-like isoform X11 n=1 Tax=Amblyraja radiata TaxID=386614 RepID=UPI001401D64C|nr:ABC transporter F family member 4-like isoform X11 [Amblyraja radiata]
MRYRKIEDYISLPSDLVFKKSKDDYNEWCPTLPENKEQLGSHKRSHDAMEEGQGSVPTQQFQGGTSKDCGGRSEEAQDQSEQDSTQQKLKKPKMLNTKKDMENREISVDNIDVQEQLKFEEKLLTSIQGDESPGHPGIYPRLPSEKDMENREISVDNIDVQEQLKIEEKLLTSIQGDESPGHPGIYPRLPSEKKDMENREISVDNIDVQEQLKIEEKLLTSIQGDESPGHPGIYPRLPSEESNAQNNHSLEAMERGQSETSPRQGQEKSSVNDEGKMTEAAPGQSEQDSTVDKKKDMENREISVDNIDVQEQLKIEELLTSIQGDESPGHPGIYPRLPSEKKDMENREISVYNIDVQEQLKIEEKLLTSIQVDESPGHPGIYPRLPSEESNAQNNHSLEAMERGQSETSPLQGQEESSVNGEGKMTEAAPGQSEQDSTVDKENNSGNNHIFTAVERGQGDLSTLQARVILKEEYSVNDEERPTEAEGQSEQDSTEDKENHSPSKCCVEVPGEQSPTPTLQRQNGNSENCEGGTSWTVQDQSEQVSTEDKLKKYELFAIWHHFGSYGSGHYIAEIKSGSGDWYSFDDSFVKKIGKNTNPRSTSAYMVMYRLVDTNKEAGSDATTPEQCQTQDPGYRIQESKNC